MKEWICRELSTSTGDSENGVLMREKELIRCKDCVHRYSTCPMIMFYSSRAIETITYRAQDDWWCCFGERKEE